MPECLCHITSYLCFTSAQVGEQIAIPSAIILLALSLLQQFKGSSCGNITRSFLCPQVFASQPTTHHGPHLCVAVLPLWADLGWQSLLAPPANSAHGQNDALQDLPGIPAELPPNLQLHPLPSSPGQPRRAHLQGNRTPPRGSLSHTDKGRMIDDFRFMAQLQLRASTAAKRTN